jgi:hypothetical protein
VVSLDFLCVYQYSGQSAIKLRSFAVITFAFGVIAFEVWDTELPVWAFVIVLITCVSASYT